MKKITAPGVESSPEATAVTPLAWKTLETFARSEIQQFIQRLLEKEIDELLGRKKSERRGEESAPGYGLVTGTGMRNPESSHSRTA